MKKRRLMGWLITDKRPAGTVKTLPVVAKANLGKKGNNLGNQGPRDLAGVAKDKEEGNKGAARMIIKTATTVRTASLKTVRDKASEVKTTILTTEPVITIMKRTARISVSLTSNH